MGNKEREQLSAELNILKDLRHPNIVAYYERDHKKDVQGLHIYMEYCGNGDLGRIINQHKIRNQPVEEAFIWGILTQVTLALFRCHYGEDPPDAGQYAVGGTPNATPARAKEGKVMILHRDLKPDNSKFTGA
jgi:NIMA (never in mitosis gene a)-related kinase 2